MDSQLVSLAESIAKELPAIYLPRNKQAPLGFSWTTFFFTMWVAVFRGYLVFAVNIVMGFLYNKLHLKELQKRLETGD